jgi:hypothetical protein
MNDKEVPIALFRIGRIVATPTALAKLTQHDILKGIQRHQAGDWGELSEEDKRENTLSLEQGFRLLSAYRAKDGSTFWIITEADRSVTSVLLPKDY